MSLVQEAVSIAFSAQKMNVELLGNGDAHAHWHIFPRREGDMKGHGLKWSWSSLVGSLGRNGG